MFVNTASTLFAFSMDPVDDLTDRFGFVVTLLLTSVALQFVVSTELPKLPYLTLLDEYVVLGFTFLFLIMMMVAIIPLFGEDDIEYVDNVCLVIAISLMTLYHVYIFVKIMIKRRAELLKITEDGIGESDGDDDGAVMGMVVKDNVKILSENLLINEGF